MNSVKFPILPLVSLLAAGTSLDAQITFVDAVHGASGNTFKTGSSMSDTTWLSTANNPTANNSQWVTRSTWGNGDTVYQSIVTSTASFPELTTRITGLVTGSYDIWAFFWDDLSLTERWILSAGLTTAALTTYSHDAVSGATTDGVVNTASLDFSNSPVISQTSGLNTYNMFGVKLGQAVVTGGTVDVFVDRNILGSSTQNRVWYDGVGFELLPPDTTPPSLVLPTSPANGATDVLVSENLVAGFNEPIALTGSGTITLVDTGDGSGTVEINVADASQVSVSGNNLVINPPANLAVDTSFQVVIDGGAITDRAPVPNAFPGTASGQWMFTTGSRSLPPGLPDDAILIQTDGAWSWFNDHTARFVNGDLYLGYVKGQAKKMAMTRYDFDTATAYEFLLGTQPSNDDHDVPTVMVLPDGRILSAYSRHNIDQVFYFRRSLTGNPTTMADWGPEQSKNAGGNNTYCNTFRLSGESDKIYNFSRAISFNPTLFTSTNNGQTWSNPVRFIARTRAGGGAGRPYVRYATNHYDRIDLIYTDDHPRESESGIKTSLYHLFIKEGNVNHTNGTLIKPLANVPLSHNTGERGTVIYQQSAAPWGPGDGPDDWMPTGSVWNWDVQYQADGKPVCAFQVQVDGAAGPTTDFKNDRIYYYYARWDGSQWRKKFIAHAGRGLFSTEDDYGGGMCIDPENPNIVYISSNVANPFDLTTLAPELNPNNEIYEIYRGTTTDGGETWNWEAITSNSDASNMRPFVPEDHDRAEALVWFRGRYTTFTNYDCDVYGLFSEPPGTGLRMRDWQLKPGGGTFKWASRPGHSYKITASFDLENFPIDVATGISAQGDTTYQPFTFSTPVSGSPRAFFRVERE